nr:uncharacterized protein LOC114924346 [Arachis hypogaea]
MSVYSKIQKKKISIEALSQLLVDGSTEIEKQDMIAFSKIILQMNRVDATGRRDLSPLQKCTAAIRMLAYGVVADAVDGYVRIGKSTTIECLENFFEGVISVFEDEYLRKSNPNDVALTACIVLEVVASSDLWIWHAFFGVSGSNNDINVLDRSPVFDDILNDHAPEILLQTSEGVTFVCENPLDLVIPFTISFEELKGVICEKIHFERARRISCILYRNPIQVFGGFIQFQTKYVTDEASMQDMFSMYIENRRQLSFIELYVEFEQCEADRNILREDYNSDSEEEFESNYEVVGPDGDEIPGDGAMALDVSDVATALANDVPFEEPSFMRVLDLEAMHVPEFPDYINADGEFAVGMEFSSRDAVIKAIKEYTIRRSVDYRVYESEPLTFYAKCIQYGSGCDWLIRVSMISRKYCWVVRKYNGSHTCTRATISQDHSKLDSTTIAEAIKPLVEVDPALKVKSVIAEVQSKFNYTEPSAVVHFETMPAYQGDDLVTDIRVLHRVFWSYYPCIRAFRHCKPVVHVDVTNLYGKYKGCLLVAVSQDGNNNIVPIAFAIVEEETSDAWHFFLSNLRQHVVTRDGVGLISDRHESINAAVERSNGAWSPPRAFHMFCIRHIESNFLRKFKAPYLQKLVVNIGYSRTVREYEVRYQRLRKRGEAYTDWLNRIPREQYALAFDVLKGARNLPVTALVKATFYRLNELFTRKRAEAEARINAGHVFSDVVTSKLHANQLVSGNIQVSCFDRQNEVFEVREMPSGLEFAVDLRGLRCDCGEFQVDRIPCRHVFACCANQRLD